MAEIIVRDETDGSVASAPPPKSTCSIRLERPEHQAGLSGIGLGKEITITLTGRATGMNQYSATDTDEQKTFCLDMDISDFAVGSAGGTLAGAIERAERVV
jgi:hypothetical protein